MNTARVRTRKEIYSYGNQGYSQSPDVYNSAVIEGYFQRENWVKEMAIRKINRTLCGLLGIFIFVAFVSYYFSMSNELKLNTLSRQITTLNDENAELQNNLDRLKSFNNVDNKMIQYNLLQKATNVIEVQAVSSTVTINKNKKKSTPFNWSIGY